MSAILLFAAGILAAAASAGQGPDPVQIWSHITETKPYTEWDGWPDHEGMQPGNSPHGVLHRVYVSPQAVSAEAAPVPYGSMVVKENYDAGQTLQALTVMFKVKDFNPDYGDWYWIKYSPEGEVQASGKPGTCVSCHSVVSDNDYIFLHVF